MNWNTLFITILDILHIATMKLAFFCIIRHKAIVTSIISIVLTPISFICTLSFSMHRNWAEAIPESELHFFLQELTNYNFTAIFLCITYAVLIGLFIYNGSLLLKKR